MVTKEEALAYHSDGRPGKIKVVPTKPTVTRDDLSLAYSPGVAEPCREIDNNPEDVYRYTAKGNLVAVITNGTAVLGLGNIGPLAGKPVRKLELPRDAALVAILRGGRVIVPQRDDPLEGGDELVFIAPTEAEPALYEAMQIAR